MWTRWLATAAAACPVLIGLGALVGYAVRVPALVRVYPSLPPMYPNTALALMVLGTGILALLWLPSSVGRRAASVAAVLVVAAFGGHLVEHIFELDATVLNRALMPTDPVVAPTTPVGNRPVVETCVAMVFLGVALWRGARASSRASVEQLAAATGGLVGLIAITGYLYGVDRVSLGDSSIATVGMAAHTAAGTMLLATALLLSRPTVGWVQVVFDRGAAGSLARRMLLVVFVVPLLLTGLVASISGSIFKDDALAASIAAASQVVVLAIVVLSPLQWLARFDYERREALEEARRNREALNDREPLISALRAELNYAGTITDSRMTMASRAEPATGVLPGDWFDLVRVGEDRYRLALVDVSGHGAAAAVFALRLKDSLMSALRRGGPLGAALEDVRPMFAGGQMMATAILIEIDLRDGHLRWVNAGHPPALHFDGSVTELPRTGPLLGLNQAPYEEAIRPLPERSLLFVHTDGLTEARNEERQLWGEERLRHLLMASARHGAETLVQVIANDVNQYTGGRFGDDATMIAIEIRPEAIE